MIHYTTYTVIDGCKLGDLQIGESCLLGGNGHSERFKVLQLVDGNMVKLESDKRVITFPVDATVFTPFNIYGYNIGELEAKDVLNKRKPVSGMTFGEITIEE